MTGAANGWAAEVITYNQGDGSQAGTIAFSQQMIDSGYCLIALNPTSFGKWGFL